MVDLTDSVTRVARASSTRGIDEDVAPDRFRFRAAVQRFVLTGLVALFVVVLPVVFWVQEEAERHALENATQITQRLADFAVAPLLTDELMAEDRVALDNIHERVRPWFEDGPVVRIKVWSPTGRIVYSDDRALVGEVLPLPEEAVALFDGREAPATLERQDAAENRSEGGAELVEAYVRTEPREGDPLVFEAYYRDALVHEEEAELLWSIVPVFVGALIFLNVAQLVPAIGLARKVESLLAGRQRLLQRAIIASDFERKRIARDLHDEVIQELAGLSYALEAEEHHGTPEDRPLLRRARSMLQQNIQTLRTMTRDLYPPDLEEAGLPTAVARLADTLRERGVSVNLDLPDRIELPPEHAATLYRVAREAMANVLKHANARVVELSLREEGDTTRLVVQDDGQGFDHAAGSPEGHFGLRVMQNTVDEAGGMLSVHSDPGYGTKVEAVVGGA